MKRKRIFQVVFGIFVIAMAFCFVYFDLHSKLSEENIQAVKNYLLQFGWWTPLVIVILYIVFNLAGLPTLFFSVLAGYLYGMYEGMALAWGGMTIGLFASFIWGRYLFRDHFIKQFGDKKIVVKLENMLQKYHVWAVVFTRASFIFPYNILNYAYSITSIRTSTYLIGSFLGILIPTLIMVYTGHLLA